MCELFLIFVAPVVNQLLFAELSLQGVCSCRNACLSTFPLVIFLHLTSDFEDSTPPQSMWLRSGPFQLIWHWSMPRWHTCGQSSHQKPKQLSGRSSYSYSSRDTQLPPLWRRDGVASFQPQASVKCLSRGSWSEADLRHAPKERTIRPVLRRFKDVPEAPKERTTMGQRPLKNSYLRVFQFRPLVVLPLGGSRTTPKLLRRGHSHPLIRGPLNFFWCS